MTIVEIARGKFINLDAICGVTVFTHERIEAPNIGGGMLGRPKKTGETFTIEITTMDGSLHHVAEEFREAVYSELFETST